MWGGVQSFSPVNPNLKTTQSLLLPVSGNTESPKTSCEDVVLRGSCRRTRIVNVVQLHCS